MVDTKILAEALSYYGINAIYQNKNSLKINHVTVLIQDNFAGFGTCKFRYIDCDDFLKKLDFENLISVTKQMKFEILATYGYLIADKNIIPLAK